MNLLKLVIAAGVGLALYQFYLNRGFWEDEALVAYNILNRDYLELLRPLDLDQIAPIGFLYVGNFLTDAFGKYDLVLSIFPLLCFLGSIPLVYGFSKRVTQDSFLALLTTAVFSILYQLIDMSSEVKQYISDVFFALLIAHASVSFNLKTYPGIIGYLFVGALAIWFSNVAVILLATFGLYQLYKWGQKVDWKIFIAFAGWGLSFGIYYLSFIKDHPNKDFMLGYWKERNSFFPVTGSLVDMGDFLIRLLEKIFGQILSFGPFWYVSLLITLFSVLYIRHRGKYELVFFSLFPVLLHIALSAFQLYPVEDRLMLYIAPFFSLLFAMGLVAAFKIVRDLLPQNFKMPSYFLVAPILVMFTPFFLYYPIRKCEVKQSLFAIEKKIKKEEVVFMDPTAKAVVNYYLLSDENDFELLKSSHVFTDNLDSLSNRFWYVTALPNTRGMQAGVKVKREALDYFQRGPFRELEKGRFVGSAHFYFEKDPAPGSQSGDQ